MAEELEKEIPIKNITAEELAKEFKEHSVAEFFQKNKQMLGLYGKVRTLTTVVHEYVTNSIDACEESGFLPDIEVKIDELGEEYYEVTIKDNGPGLTEQTVGKALGQLLAGTKFHRLMQSRGQQGIGSSACTMLSQMTTGKPIKVITGTGKGKPISLELTIDPKKNAPKITNIKEVSKDFRGTAIQAKFKGVIYRDSEQGVLEYLRRTAIANPHVEISFRAPNGTKIVFKRTQNKIPKLPTAVKPHPKGIAVNELISMAKYTDARKVNSFLKNDFDRMGNKSLEDLAKKVNFDLNKDPRQLAWHEAEEIIKAFKEIDFIAPKADGLRPIGEEQIRKSINSIVTPDFLTVITRKPQVYAGGFPFQVEVAIAYGGGAGRSMGDEKKVEIMRFANRVPLLFDAGNDAITKAVHSIDWKRYDIRDVDNAPLTIMVNFISVHIPYTGAGKQAIADEEEVVEELRLALMDSGRKAGRFISGKKREKEMQMKRQLFYKYIPEIAGALGRLTKTNEDMLKKNLEKMVLEKLKLDEAKMIEINDEENAKTKDKQADIKEKKMGIAEKIVKKKVKKEGKR
ncbi:MAG: DNA topoisomerase VI subunit B [Candidatus Diapherotrites archaeon]